MKRRRPTNDDENPQPQRPGLIASGKPGRLTAPDGEAWPVRVAQGDDDVLMLVMLVGGQELGPDKLGPLTLECTSEHGVARFEGEVVLEQPDLLRFTVKTSADIEQRREFVRVQSPQQVVLAVTGSDKIDSALSVDLSGGGMLLNGPDTLKLDDNIRFRVHLDRDEEPIRGRARVVRCGDDGQRAIVFEQISRRDRERLIHFIFDRQRAARAKTRGLTT
jgi:hypothetical protein